MFPFFGFLAFVNNSFFVGILSPLLKLATAFFKLSLPLNISLSDENNSISPLREIYFICPLSPSKSLADPVIFTTTSLLFFYLNMK